MIKGENKRNKKPDKVLVVLFILLLDPIIMTPIIIYEFHEYFHSLNGTPPGF